MSTLKWVNFCFCFHATTRIHPLSFHKHYLKDLVACALDRFCLLLALLPEESLSFHHCCITSQRNYQEELSMVCLVTGMVLEKTFLRWLQNPGRTREKQPIQPQGYPCSTLAWRKINIINYIDPAIRGNNNTTLERPYYGVKMLGRFHKQLNTWMNKSTYS